MGRMPTPTILISLATWLWIYNTHQIPDSMCTKSTGIPEWFTTMSILNCLICTCQISFPPFLNNRLKYILFDLSPCRAIGLMKKFEMNQLNYRLSHPVAALQTSLTKEMDKYSRIRFDYASFDAQVFGKQPLMGTNQDQEVSHFPDCKAYILINQFFFIVCFYMYWETNKFVL